MTDGSFRFWRWIALVTFALVGLSLAAHCQSPNVKPCLANAAAPTFLEASANFLSCDLAGNLRTSSGATGGGAAQLQVRNAADSAWVNVGFNVANLTLPVTLQTSSAVIGHVIVDTAPSTTVTGTVTANQGTANTAANAWPQKITDGTNTAAVKAASTAAAATDPALVVAVSPNNTVAVTQATAANLNATVVGTTLTKGTQGATGFSTQDLKDAGRTRISFTADAVTPAASETAVTFVKTVAGTATTAQTSYTVTSGKTFRLQSLHLYYAMTSTTLSEVRLAMREGASCGAASALVIRLGAGAPVTSATSVAHEAATQADFTIPDGFEFPATTVLCFSAIATSTSSALTFTAVGYEY